MVCLTVWGVPARRVPGALRRRASQRRRIYAAPGIRFAKILGTGRGFGLRDADPRHWALLTVWDGDRAADAFADGRVHRSWDAIAEERMDVRMTPLSTRGSWSGHDPFTPVRPATSGPIASLTRARIRTAKVLAFHRAIAPPAAAILGAPGVQLAFGIGEAPVGLQATFSLWRSPADLHQFAYGGEAHAGAIRRARQGDWFSEELFARFAVRSASGAYLGRAIDPVLD